MQPPLARALAAELIGTFALVFAGAGAVMVDAKTHALGHVGVAFTFGLVIMAMIYAVGHISRVALLSTIYKRPRNPLGCGTQVPTFFAVGSPCVQRLALQHGSHTSRVGTSPSGSTLTTCQHSPAGAGITSPTE
jgi:hypothetical protein